MVETALRGPQILLFDELAADAADYTSPEVVMLHDQVGAQLFLDITAEDGTATLDCKLQAFDGLNTWIDIPGAAFAQKSGVGLSMLTIYPGIASSAGVSLPLALPHAWRAVVTVGSTGNMDFSLSGTTL